MASPENWQAKQWSLPVSRLMVADGVLSSCSPVGQVTLTNPSPGGSGLSR